MKKLFSFISTILILGTISFGQTTDLIISEYIEGSSNNKAFEIFNGTGATVDLTNYVILQSSNGNGWQFVHTFPTGASIANEDVWVIITDQVNPTLFDPANADEVLPFPSVVHFNGDDARALAYISGSDTTIVDIFGEPDNDPGSGWDVAGVSAATANHTLIRKSTISSPNTDWVSSAGTSAGDSEWMVEAQDYFADLGMHTFTPALTATDLIISEYIEGSSNNKAFEIFNGTGATVDLTNYVILQSSNGNGWQFVHTFPTGASIANEDVWVIITDQVNPTLFDPANADEVLPFPSVVHFNGDDARALAYISGSDTTIVDIFGEPDNDPGSGWDVAGVSAATANHTLIRKSTISSPNTDWVSSAGTSAGDSEWMVEAQDYFADLGMHTFGAAANTPPVIGAVTVAPQVPMANEDGVVTADVSDDGTIASVTLNYMINSGATQTVAMTETLSEGIEAIYSGAIPASAYVDGDLVEYYVEATDDQNETTTSATAGFLAGTTDISIAKTVDADGVLVYLGYYARLTGVATVESGLYQTSNLDVNIQDATGGINLFAFGFTNTIARGNSYTVVGELDQYNGKSEIIPDNESDITDNGPGVLPAFMQLTIAQALADPELYEGSLVGIALVTNTGTGDAWPADGSNANLIVSDDGGTTNLIMRIDKDTEIDGTPEPTWPKDVIGIFNQFDSSSPYDEGYQIIPRDLNDLGDGIVPVELVSFSAVVSGSQVDLSWKTATEINNLGFEIQRAGDEKEWQKVGFVEGTNTATVQSYQFSDKPQNVNGALYYRLKQIDVDGTFSLSPEVEVNFGVPLEYDLAQNFPNPFNPTTNIRFSVPEQANVKITVFNVLGQQVAVLLNETFEAGAHNVKFNASSMNSGVFYYRIEANDYVQVKKMMLLK